MGSNSDRMVEIVYCSLVDNHHEYYATSVYVVIKHNKMVISYMLITS
jgi:hypothetical protein